MLQLVKKPVSDNREFFRAQWASLDHICLDDMYLTFACMLSKDPKRFFEGFKEEYKAQELKGMILDTEVEKFYYSPEQWFEWFNSEDCADVKEEFAKIKSWVEFEAE